MHQQFWGIEYGIWCLFAYVAVALLGLGVWWELQDDDERDLDQLFEVGFPALFWGVFLVVGVAIGAAWLLSWIPRGPVRLVKYIINGRREIPEARVVSK